MFSTRQMKRIGTPGRWIDQWAVASQQGARRNAMIASTALTQRRAERDEVEEFLAQLHSPAPAPAASAAHG